MDNSRYDPEVSIRNQLPEESDIHRVVDVTALEHHPDTVPLFRGRKKPWGRKARCRQHPCVVSEFRDSHADTMRRLGELARADNDPSVDTGVSTVIGVAHSQLHLPFALHCGSRYQAPTGAYAVADVRYSNLYTSPSWGNSGRVPGLAF